MSQIKNTEHTPAKNPTRTSAIQYDYIMNGYQLSPNYIQNIVSRQKVGAIGAGGYGAYRFQENNDVQPFKRLGPHTHPETEYFIFYSTDPKHPDSIGGTTEFWIGTGEDAEPYVITKPTIVTLPPNVSHLPEIYRGFDGVNAQTVIFESSLWSISDDFDVDAMLSPKLKVNPIFKPADVSQFGKKYADCVQEQNLVYAPKYASHKGKAEVILQSDIRTSPHATKCIEATLIYGEGIGWGCGDMVQFRDYKVRSQPHVHDSLETYIFISTNPDKPAELGAEIEFWIGEGDNAEKLIINKPTILLIPPNTVHLPMYVNKLDTPVLCVSAIDNPLWNVFYSNVYPTGFEHEIVPADYSEVQQFNLHYDAEKCIHCGICGMQCQVNGIDIEADPVKLGEPCIRCGQCAVLCESGAITVTLDKKQE